MNESISNIQRLLQEIADHLKSGTKTDTERPSPITADRRAGLDLGPHDPGTAVALFDRTSVTDNYGNTVSL